MKDGTLQETGDRTVIRFERHLNSTVPAVWQAITDREELKAWFPCHVTPGDWVAGASLEFVFPEHGFTLSGVVLEVDEPRVLSFMWGEETLRMELSPEGEGTRLVFTDELPPGIAARNAAGWDVCLARLAHFTPVPEWKPLFEHYGSLFTPVLGHQEGPPADLNHTA